jgi:hypothetical protein
MVDQEVSEMKNFLVVIAEASCPRAIPNSMPHRNESKVTIILQ